MLRVLRHYYRCVVYFVIITDIMAAKHATIEIVGFTARNNGRSCNNHHCCGESLVIDAHNNGIGTMLRLRLTAQNELSAHTILGDGSDGCRVGFTFQSFANNNGVFYDGSIVELVDVYTADSEDKSERRKFYSCKGYSLARVVKTDTSTNK